MAENLEEAIEQAIKTESIAEDFDRIESRHCASDNYDGIQFNIYGNFVSIRPIIDTVADADGWAIEEIQFVDEGEPHLGLFVASIPKQPHPAFVD